MIRGFQLFVKDDSGESPDTPTFPLEMASRALGERPERTENGAVRLAGAEIPGSRANARWRSTSTPGSAPIPVYSLSDLWDCAQNERQDFFATHFKDKVVVLGAVLDVEDRKITSQRFLTQPDL